MIFTAAAAGQDIFPELQGHSTDVVGMDNAAGPIPLEHVLERAQILYRVRSFPTICIVRVHGVVGHGLLWGG